MRIGIFTTDFPFKGPFDLGRPVKGSGQWGGVAEVVYHLGLNLSAKNHDVKVFTTSPTGKDIVKEHGSMTVYAYKAMWNLASTPLSPRLLRRPLEHDLDIVHGHMGTPPGAFAAYDYSRMKEVPLVTTIHTPYNEVSTEGASPAKKLSLLLFMRGVLSPMLRASDAITTVSLPVMEESPSYRPFIPKATLIENGVDLKSLSIGLTKEECRERLGIGQEKRVVLFVGSMSPYKNPDLLLNAFAALNTNHGDPFLVMLGDGVLRKNLVERSLVPSLRGKVRMPGFISEQEKLLYYGAADIFALPSLAEAFPLTLIEASVFGLPLLLSDIDIFKETVDRYNSGIVFRCGDQDDLTEKLAFLLESGEKRLQLGSNARKFAEKRDWSSLSSKYVEIYKGLVP